MYQRITKLLITSLLFLKFVGAAQASSGNWGEFQLAPSTEYNGVTLKFDWLRENMFIKISDEGYTYTIGGDDILLEYRYIIANKVFKLQEVHNGVQYLQSEKVKEHKEIGFPIVGTDMQALRFFVLGFMEAVVDAYKLKPSDRNGFQDPGYESGYGVELYGNGNAYLGTFEEAARNGEGKYILVDDGGWQIMYGVFSKGIQHGEFVVDYSDGTRAHGQFVKGQVDGVWRYLDVTGSLDKKVKYELGTFIEQYTGGQGPYSTFASDTTLETVWVNEMENGEMTAQKDMYSFVFKEDVLRGYQFGFLSGVGLGRYIKNYSAELNSVSESRKARVETYTYYFKEHEGKSTITITSYAKKQCERKKEFNVKVYLKTDDFERELYFLL